MRKILILTLAAAMLLTCFSGCAQREETEETAYLPQIATINSQTELEGKTLTIDAKVEIPNLSKLEKITLNFDEERFQAMGKDLVLSQYPEIQEGRSPDGYRGWSKETPERLIISLHCMDEDSFEAGRCYFVDVLRDLNGQTMPGDEEHSWEPYYLTENIPNELGMTSAEAAKKIGSELAKYSCFTYMPWNVTACNIREKPGSSGYYSAIMQPMFENRPVYGHGALRVSSHMSAEGLFAFQGIILLKETGRTAVSCAMDLDAAVAKFQEEFVEEAEEGVTVFVDKITAGYKATSEYDGTWTLHPVWAFSCREERKDYTHYYTSVYKMENGKLSVID